MVDHVLELVPEVLQEALHRPRRGIPEAADRMALDAVGHVEQQPEVLAPRPAPARMRLSMRFSQPVPSRQGVHWPQDSAM